MKQAQVVRRVVTRMCGGLFFANIGYAMFCAVVELTRENGRVSYLWLVLDTREACLTAY